MSAPVGRASAAALRNCAAGTLFRSRTGTKMRRMLSAIRVVPHCSRSGYQQDIYWTVVGESHPGATEQSVERFSRGWRVLANAHELRTVSADSVGNGQYRHASLDMYVDFGTLSSGCCK